MNEYVLDVENRGRFGFVSSHQDAAVGARVEDAGVADDHRLHLQFPSAILLVNLRLPLVKMAQLHTDNRFISLLISFRLSSFSYFADVAKSFQRESETHVPAQHHRAGKFEIGAGLHKPVGKSSRQFARQNACWGEF